LSWPIGSLISLLVLICQFPCVNIGPHILLIILLSNIRCANSSVALKVHVSAPCAITGCTRVLYSLTSVLLCSMFHLNNCK
jgi:hypothetical protein